MGLEDRVRAAHCFEPSRFRPFVADGTVLGYLRHDFAAALRIYGDVLEVGTGAVTLRAALKSFETRSRAMAEVAASLAARGLLTKWRNETYDIRPRDGGAPCFALERSAVRFFGCSARAVHLNGIVPLGGAMSMWIARRSPEKAIDPGMFDNLMGGGIATGLSVEQTLVKEAWEEAGIAAALARQARSVGRLQVLREVPDGLHAETIYVHDLSLPDSFVPVNQDGEVIEFRLLSLDAVGRELAGDAPYTIDAGLVALDCLARHLAGFGNRISSPD